MINNILVIDTETSGISTKDYKLLEVGAIFYNIPSKSIIYEIATLINSDTNEAEHINHIKVDALQVVNETMSDNALRMIGSMMMVADVIIAHNHKFDKSWIETHSLLAGISQNSQWKCSCYGINWRKITPGKKLSDIAGHCGVPYTNAHRALADCRILLKCLQTLPDLQEQLAKV